MVQVIARSVSRQVQEWLDDGRWGRVLAVHARVCNLVTGHGEVIALVAPEIGDGPLNIVLEVWPGFLSNVQVGKRVTLGPDRLVLGSLGWIDLEDANTWSPCPDWDELRARRTEIEASLALFVALCLDHDPSTVLLTLLGAPSPAQGRAVLVVERFREAAGLVAAGWRGDEGALVEGGVILAGLGDGLTPAGDDWLVGVMLWAWLAHPNPQRFCRVLSESAALRTTTLSAAFLHAAARGQCSVAWHRLLAALAEGEMPGMTRAAQAVLAYGASSGLDALIGFLGLSRGQAEQAR